MTLLFMDGMDLFGATSELTRRYDSVEGTSVAFGAALGRYGGGGIVVSDDDKYFSKSIPGTPQTAVVSFAIFRDSSAASADVVWKWDTDVSNGGLTFKTVPASASITVLRGTTELGTFAVGTGEWHWVSMKVKISDSTGTIDVEVDGVSVFSFAGDTLQAGTAVSGAFVFGGEQTVDFTYDDIIVTDVAGSAPFNDLLSDRRIDTILPNAVGDSSGFTASPAVDNYLNVDDTAPDDDTTYVEAEASTTKDLYNMASMGFSPGSIDLVNVVALARNPDAGGTQLKLIATEAASGATEATGSAQTPTSGYGYLDEQFLLNPETAAAWTESEVNGIQAGMEIV